MYIISRLVFKETKGTSGHLTSGLNGVGINSKGINKPMLNENRSRNIGDFASKIAKRMSPNECQLIILRLSGGS